MPAIQAFALGRRAGYMGADGRIRPPRDKAGLARRMHTLRAPTLSVVRFVRMEREVAGSTLA
jgi:hypothetical protein